MRPQDVDAVLLLLFGFTVAVVSLLLLLQVYMVCFLKRAAAQGNLSTGGSLLPARDAAVDAAAAMAGSTEPERGVDPPTWASLPGRSCGWDGDEEAGDCVVCLSALAEDGGGGAVTVLPRCRHAFHDGCIGRWLVSHSVCCPICRTPARPDPPAQAAAVTSPPLSPQMAVAVRWDEEEGGGVGGVVREDFAQRGAVLPEEHHMTEEHHLPLLLLY